MLRHSLIYLLARGVPALLNFGCIVIFTRMLAPETYGQYTLVISGVTLVNILLFQWVRVSLVRYFPAHAAEPRQFLSLILTLMALLGLGSGALGLGLAALTPDPVWRGLILLSVPLLWVLAWLELNLELLRSQLDPLRYGVVYLVRSLGTLALGVLLILWGFGAYGPLLGMGAGLLVGGLLLADNWRGVRPARPDPALLSTLLAYGLPLTGTFALDAMVEITGRFLIAHFHTEHQVGVYAAGYDLIQNTMTLLLFVVNLAAFPLVLRALERQGAAAAREKLGQNGLLLLALGLPAAVGVALLTPNIARTLLGSEFAEAQVILPLVAVAMLIAGFKRFHLDLAYQLGQRTYLQLYNVAAAALTSALLGWWLIPSTGIVGAAWAVLGAYVVGAAVSWALGRHAFAVSLPLADSLKVLAATGAMALVLWNVRHPIGLPELLVQIVVGGSVYGLACYALDVGGVRDRLDVLAERLSRPLARRGSALRDR